MPTPTLPDILAWPSVSQATTMPPSSVALAADFAFARLFAGADAAAVLPLRRVAPAPDLTETDGAAEADDETVPDDAAAIRPEIFSTGQTLPFVAAFAENAGQDSVKQGREAPVTVSVLAIAATPVRAFFAQASAEMPDAEALALSVAETPSSDADSALKPRGWPVETIGGQVPTVPHEPLLQGQIAGRGHALDNRIKGSRSGKTPVIQDAAPVNLTMAPTSQIHPVQTLPATATITPTADDDGAAQQAQPEGQVKAVIAAIARSAIAPAADTGQRDAGAKPQVAPCAARYDDDQTGPAQTATTRQTLANSGADRGRAPAPVRPGAAPDVNDARVQTGVDGLTAGPPDWARSPDQFRSLHSATIVLPPHDTARHIAAQLVVGVTKAGNGSTDIALDPVELGRVRMQMTTTDQTLTIVITAERPDTADLMRRHIDTLTQEFRDQGYRQVNVDIGERSDRGAPSGNAPKADGQIGAAAEPTETAARPAATLTRAAMPGSSTLDLRL